MNSYSSKPWIHAYSEGVRAEIDTPTQTLSDMLNEAVDRFSSLSALSFFGAKTTYGQLGTQVAKAAESLRKLGVSKGDRVAIILPNCPQHVVAYYAVLRLGAIVVEHNPLYTERELRHQFEDHGARVAIAWDKLCDTIADFPKDVPIDQIIAVNLTEALPLSKRIALKLPIAKARASRKALTQKPKSRRVIAWAELLQSPPIKLSVPGPELSDIALLQYTSGTTGHPKGAILTHRNLRANAMQGRAWVPGLEDGVETFYGVLPLFHAYGLTLCLSFALSIGAKLVLFPNFDAERVIEAARKDPPTFLPAVPPIYQKLAEAAASGAANLSSIRYAISGAMSLPVSTVEQWEGATGGLLVEGYGMTEASPIVMANPVGPTRRAGTVGVPFPSTEIRVVDPENPDQDVPFNSPGELLVRGPQVFQGYWHLPEETAKVLTADGWLRTGDIVSVDQDGFVTIIDRMKELIITGGFNVSPSEVEHVIVGHPNVAQCAVVGLPQEGGSEEVTAAVVLRPGTTLNLNELRSFCKESLTPYKVPRKLVLLSELPTSLIGKVLRRTVREQLLNAQPRD